MIENQDYLIFSNVNKYTSDEDPLTWIGNAFFKKPNAHNDEYCIFSDQYGYLNRFSKWKLDPHLKNVPAPIYNGTSEEFEEILTEELESLRNKKFALLYSGGVDSTTILVTLLKMGINEFTLVYSAESIEEYPLMFEKINDIKTITKVMFSFENFEQIWNDLMRDNILVSGCYADRLYFSYYRSNRDAFNYANWKDFMKTVASPNIIDMFLESFMHYDVNIITPYQFYFWLKFSITNVFFYPAIHIKSLANGHNYYSPYLNDKFASWAMSRFDRIVPFSNNEPEKYKVEMKRIIMDYTKDDDYFNTKSKIRSFGQITKGRLETLYIVDTKGVHGYKNNSYTDLMLNYTEKYRIN